MALTHEKVGHTGKGLWGHRGMQLPAYIQHIANDLIHERAIPESQAVQMAIGLCQKWARGGADVKPDTRAKAAAAIAEWEALKVKAKATRSGPMSDHDPDGLDASWDGDLSDLPDLTGLDVPDFEAAAGPAAEGEPAARAAKLGSGARFAALKASLAKKGASDPGALAAWIGRRKFGRAKFSALASAARKGATASRSSLMELRRDCQLEDIHIVRTAEGDSSGRVVEAYAAVFDQPVKIKDEQGRYVEIIERSAFDDALREIRRSRGGLPASVKVLFNHGKTQEGVPAAEFQKPLGKPLSVEAESRGLLTRTEYAKTRHAEEVLELIRAGAITAQSFVGGIMRSDPELPGPGSKYRARNGALTTVRRMMLGLREYGPVLWPAYSGAEILGVRMQLPGSPEYEPDSPEDVEDGPANEGLAAADTREEVVPSRLHAHRLWQLRTEELCRQAGLVLPGRETA